MNTGPEDLTAPRRPVLPAARRPYRARRAGAALLAMAVLAGCAGPDERPPGNPVAAAPPVPVGVEDPAKIPSPGPPDTSCDPLASLRPPATMPAPGQMPAGSTMARIAQRGRLVVGVDQNTYLFGFRNPSDNNLVGFDIDMARQVAQAIFGDPNRIQFRTLSSNQRIPVVQSGDVDLVADVMTINCERWQQVAFSTDYYDSGQAVLVRSDSAATGIQDLHGQKVCAVKGSTSIPNIANAPSHPIPVAVNDWTDCLVMLQQGQVEAVSTDNSILVGLAAQDPNTKLVGKPFTREPYGMAMNKSATDLVRFVNGVLDKMRSDGTWTSIYNRWLTGLGPAPAPPPARYQD